MLVSLSTHTHGSRTVALAFTNDTSSVVWVPQTRVCLLPPDGNYFQFESSKVTYTGKSVKRKPYSKDDCVEISAGECITVMVDLDVCYDFEDVSTTSVRYRTVVPLIGVDETHMLESNWVELGSS